MADPVPAGSDVSAGSYSCTQCNYELQVGSTEHLPPCPSCGNGRGTPSLAATAPVTHIPTAGALSGKAFRPFPDRGTSGGAWTDGVFALRAPPTESIVDHPRRALPLVERSAF